MEEKSDLSRNLLQLLEAFPESVPQDDPYSILNNAGKNYPRVMPEIWLAYLKGEFEQIKILYNGINDDATILAAAGIAIAAAISMGDYSFFLEVENYLKKIIQANISADVTTYAQCQLSVAYIGTGAPNMVPEWLKTGDFSALPIHARSIAAHIRTNYLSLLNNPDALIAASQAYLSVYAVDGISFPDTYLRIHCAEGCYAAGRKEDAEKYLVSAMEKNLPHGFITPFADRVIRFGGLCEEIIKSEFPAHLDAVVELSKCVIKNWIDFHYRFTRDNIIPMLSIRENEIARAYSRGESYGQIAKQLNIATGTVRNTMNKIYQTLMITGSDRREKLKKLLW